MKNVYVKLIFFATLILFGLGEMTTVTAQTDTEKQLKELKARRELAKEKQGLLTEELAAESYETPCTLYDDKDWYTAFNQKEGRKGDPKLAEGLFHDCKRFLLQKIGGAYKNVTRDYFDQMDINDKSNAASHIESAGEMVIEKIINDVLEYCRKEVNDADRGNIIVYMSIRVSKKEIVEKIVREVSKDKELGVRFNEEKFRESAFKVFDKDTQE